MLEPGDIVIAYDPGVTTGLCVARVIASRVPGSLEVLESREVLWDEAFLEWKTLHKYRRRLRAVVIEEFVMYSSKADDLIGSSFPACEMIGVLRAQAHRVGVLDLVVKQLAVYRTAVRVLPEHAPKLGSSPHRKDAYQHARYYILGEARKQAKSDRAKSKTT